MPQPVPRQHIALQPDTRVDLIRRPQLVDRPASILQVSPERGRLRPPVQRYVGVPGSPG